MCVGPNGDTWYALVRFMCVVYVCADDFVPIMCVSMHCVLGVLMACLTCVSESETETEIDTNSKPNSKPNSKRGLKPKLKPKPKPKPNLIQKHQHQHHKKKEKQKQKTDTESRNPKKS